jgi:hypothetical protein
VNAIIDGRDDIVLQVIDDVHSQGSDLKIFVEQFLNFCLDLSKYAIFGNCSLTKLPSSMESEMKNATAIENAKGYYYTTIINNYTYDEIQDKVNSLQTNDPYNELSHYKNIYEAFIYCSNNYCPSSFDEVGIKPLNDFKLQFTLTKPTPL